MIVWKVMSLLRHVYEKHHPWSIAPFSRSVYPAFDTEASEPVYIGILSLSNQRQHRTLHIQNDVLPCALCLLLCPVSAALASISRMGNAISTSYT